MFKLKSNAYFHLCCYKCTFLGGSFYSVIEQVIDMVELDIVANGEVKNTSFNIPLVGLRL